MRYKSFEIENYRAIKNKLTIDLEKRIVPLVGINECGKTTILQAIFCFDHGNDDEADGKHLKDTKNLYETGSSTEAKVTAIIESPLAELIAHVAPIIATYKTSHGNSSFEELSEYEGLTASPNTQQTITFALSRELSNKKYTFTTLFSELPLDTQDKLGREIIAHLPYILYNDDFNDRPPNSISISSNGKAPNGWEAIFDRVFKSANPTYSLSSTISEPDSKTRKSIIADVEGFLNSALTNEWAKFGPKRQKISTSLDLDVEKRKLNIMIEDELNGNKRYFDISNRSKGFIWYYNFIMKIRFNPKHNSSAKDTVFLLDEPGSYLHEVAQANLCKKLKDVSDKEGIVVYCTHSPRLLSPEHIPINNILIVDKSKAGHISATNISAYKTSSKKNSALQPLYEALMTPEYEIINKDEKILCVEGIYDKYSLELFMDIPSNCRIFPSVCAEAIINNIQYFIAYQKPYIALWDNDDEGKKCLGKAKKLFGLQESENFLLLPAPKEKSKRRMEEMYSQEDLNLIRSELSLSTNATYEATISALYFCDTKKKSAIIKKVSSATKGNFETLSHMLSKHFSD